MTGFVSAAIISLALAVALSWALPAWAARALLPKLTGSGMLVTNYRGRRIPTGLGIVWVVWAAGMGAAQALVRAATIDSLGASPLSAYGWVEGLAYDTMLLLPPLLVAGAFAFGLIDDAFGDHEARGFRGHLREMAAGRLTTGGLKLIGIGLLAVAAGASTYSVNGAISEGLLQGGFDLVSLIKAVVAWVCAAGVVALTANLINLMDLRPGRALKAYSALAAVGLVIIAPLTASLVLGYGSGAQSYEAAGALAPYMLPIVVSARLLLAAVLAFGPVFAVWRLDLGERGMLGDAGANAMGALAGFLLVVRAPLPLVVVLFVILLALNLASEKVSFSKVIERFAFLKWFDGLGREPVPASGGVGENGDGGLRAGGPGAEGDDARRDGGA